MNNKITQKDILVEVRDLKKFFPTGSYLLRKRVSAELKAVDGVNLKIRSGQTLGLVGESGCGKTTVGRCILRLYQPTSGHVFFKGTEISNISERQLRRVRRRMQPIFQDPFGSLNPRQTAESIVGEPLKVHGLYKGVRRQKARVVELFQMVGLDPSMASRYPHEFSGGQRQRIGVARALASDPEFIVSDEPVSALDVSIQAQIVNLLENIQKKLGLTQLFISHDLAVVRRISQEVAIMYLGRIVEIARSRDLYEKPLHPYTKALLSAIPIPDPFLEEKRERIVLSGDVPSPVNPPQGCPFHPRCFLANNECRDVVPALKEVEKDHHVACIRV